MQRHTKVKNIVLKPEYTNKEMSDKEIQKAKEKEGFKIINRINNRDYVIALDLGGTQLTSIEFSKKIKDLRLRGKSNITFIIGGSHGLSDDVLKKANYKLCFSKMTFPHKLMKVILMEQIYRAFKIISNEPYHK